MKNYDPFVFGPAFAIEIHPTSWFNLKFSSSNLSPNIAYPPVPSLFVKSPPYIINYGMTLWKGELLYFPDEHNVIKFSTVFGTISPNKLNSNDPTSLSPIWTLIKTLFVIV